MAKPVTKPRRDRDESNTPRSDRARLWCLAAATALLVARPLLPSENSALRGDDVPFALAWLLLALVWAATGMRARRCEFRGGWLDLGVVLLAGWTACSGLVALSTEAPRPTLNQTWSWVAAIIAFLLLRQLVRDAREVRAVVVVMVGLGFTLALVGYHQFFVDFPATRAAYAEDPDTLLRSIGQWYPPGSAERELFEQRLGSDEPLATFALANSLAGFFAAWVPVGLGIVLGALAVRRWRYRVVGGGVLISVAMAGCLLLTKSRSAYASTLLAVVMLAVVFAPRGGVNWRVGLTLGVMLLVLVGIGVGVGSLDWQVLSEAPKSLGYRLEYWQASVQVALDHPWFGCGPGNFKDHYTRYKLPAASEEISDPHNFLIELWATAGTPALVLVVILVCAAAEMFGARWRRRVEPPPGQPTSGSAAPIVWGGCAGMGLAMLSGAVVGPVFDIPLSPAVALVGLGVMAGTSWLLWPWVREGQLDAVVLVIAGTALMINLLAAGGISYGGVVGSLWLLAALGLTMIDLERPRLVGASWMMAAGALGLAVLCWACFVTAYRPVVASHLALAAAQGVPSQAEQHLREAVEADPWGFEAPWLWAGWNFERWRQQATPEAWSAFVEAERDCLDSRPRWASAWAQRGRWYLEAYERTGDVELARSAVSKLRQAVELYPHKAEFWARLGLAYEGVGEEAEMQRAAEEAWRLDEVTPHVDLKLSDELRNRLPRDDSR